MTEQGQRTEKTPLSGAKGLGIVMGAMIGTILVLAVVCILLAP